jgi:hypothetical protein
MLKYEPVDLSDCVYGNYNEMKDKKGYRKVLNLSPP